MIVVDVTRVSDSCGYAVPKMALVAEREALDATWRSRDDETIATYKVERNAESLDGLPGLEEPGERPRRPSARTGLPRGRSDDRRARVTTPAPVRRSATRLFV